MAKKTIKINLSEQSIQNAINQIENYKRELVNKNDKFVKRLAEVGIPVISQNVASAIGDLNKGYNAYIRMNSFDTYSKATLVVEGKDILFIEFGSGVHYNGAVGGSPHPKGAEFGYTIGSYGEGKGKNDFWFYYADTGESIMSHGTKATMPVYKASVEIIQNIRKVAREVFGS